MTTKISSTGIDFPDGDAANPSMGGTDTNTGLFYGTDTVAVSTGGSERVRVASNGRVGIGETSPDTNLHINGGASNNVLKLESTDGTCSMEFYDNATTNGNQPIAGGVGNNFYIEAGGSERLRVQSDGHVKINDGDLVIGTAGHGIDFSAQTASSQSGITTGDETLDHYEEGTWTPTITFGGGSTGVTYSVNTGRYTRIGNRVFVSCYILLSDKGSSDGVPRVAGFPFLAANISNLHMTSGFWMNTINFGNAVPVGYLSPNQYTFRIERMQCSGNTGVWGADRTNFTDTTDIMLNLTYQT